MVLFWFIVLLAVCPLLRLLFRRLKIELGYRALRRTAIIHAGLLALSILLLWLARYDIYIRGYASLSIAFVLMVLSGITLYLLMPHGKTPALTIVLSIFASAGLVMAFCITMMKITEYDIHVFYNSAEYRLERTSQGFMAPPRIPSLFVKHGLLETKYEADTDAILFRRDISSVEVKKLGDKRYQVIYVFADTTNSYSDLAPGSDRIEAIYE
jgi:hypothetical protein